MRVPTPMLPGELTDGRWMLGDMFGVSGASSPPSPDFASLLSFISCTAAATAAVKSFSPFCCCDNTSKSDDANGRHCSPVMMAR